MSNQEIGYRSEVVRRVGKRICMQQFLLPSFLLQFTPSIFPLLPLLPILIILLAAPLHAQDKPFLRIQVTPEEVAVGQSIKLQISVFVPTWFSGPPQYPSFEIPNAITRLPPDSSYPTNERVNGETWSGIVREYEIFPLVRATYRLSNLEVDLTYADPTTRKPIASKLALPQIIFKGVVPEGAQDLDPYLAGNRFTLTRDIKGNPQSMSAGDAIVLTYQATLEGLPGIFIPPLVEAPDWPGVSSYLKDPSVKEENGVATRTEELTLIFETGGEYLLPNTTLRWWNLAEGKIETSSIEPLVLKVEGPALADSTTRERGTNSLLQTLFAIIAALIVFIIFVKRGIPAITKKRLESRRRYESSEPFAFSNVKSALQKKDAKAAHRAIGLWIAKLCPTLSSIEFVERYTQRSEILKLSASLFSNDEVEIDFHSIYICLKKGRSMFTQEMRSERATDLPQLNPQ